MTRTIVTVVVCATLLWVGTTLAAGTLAQSCEKAKDKAAGKYGQCIATQRGKEISGKVPDYAECATKLSDAFTKAETKAAGACPTTGDEAQVQSRLDGVWEPSNALPRWLHNIRFVDNGDGTVSDTLTGLMWEKKDTTCPGPHCESDTFTWCSGSYPSCTNSTNPPDGTLFTTFLSTLNNGASTDGGVGTAITGCFANHCDWRLPTIVELDGILDPTQGSCNGGSGPCIDPLFGPTQSFYYWSTTTYAGDPLDAWILTFAAGSGTNYPKAGNVYARAVRGGL